MRSFIALVWHEILERRAMLVVAVFIALAIPVMAPLLPGTGSYPTADVREILMWAGLGSVVPVFALLLGASFIGGDLAEGRMGFYYVQPLSGPMIWFGKLTAVVALIWAVQMMIMLPTALLSGDVSRILFAGGLFLEPVGEWVSSVVCWLGPPTLILIAHAVGLVWRARSVWMVADTIALLALVGAVRLVKGPFLQVFAAQVLLVITGWLVFMAIVGLVAAGAVQVTVGRVDARRGHRALSAVLWSVLAVAVITAAVWGRWVRSASPSDLTRVNEISVGSGEWIAVTGHSKGRFDYYPGFLVNAVDGRWVLAHSGSNVHERGLAFSGDQNLAVWTEPSGFEEMRLMAVDLTSEALRPRWTGIAVRRDWGDLVVSPIGERIALVEEGTVTAYEIDSGVLVAAAQIAGDFWPFRVHFVDEETVEVLVGKREGLSGESDEYRMRWRLHLLDLVTRSMGPGRDIDGAWRWWGGRLDNLIRNSLEKKKVDGQERLFLTDSSTGETIADLGEMPARWSDVRIAGDSWIVIAGSKPEEKHLRIFDEETESFRRFVVPEPGWLQLGGEVARGRLSIGLVVWPEKAGEPAERVAKIIEVSTGEVVQSLAGMSPVLGRWGLSVSPGAWEAGSVATRLMDGPHGTLHLLNSDTGDLEQIIPVSN